MKAKIENFIYIMSKLAVSILVFVAPIKYIPALIVILHSVKIFYQ